MTVSNVDKKKQKLAYKKLMKPIIKGSQGFVKLSYYVSKLLFVVALLVGGISAYSISVKEHYAFEYIMSLVLFGAIFGISYMLSAVYKGFARGTIIKKYKLPLSADDERLSFDGNRFIYSFRDTLLRDSADTSRFIFEKANVSIVEYDEETRLIRLKGKIIEDRCKGDKVINQYKWSEISIINTFEDVDLYKELI